MSQLRFTVVKEAFSHKAVEVNMPKEKPSQYFGKYVFNRQKMYEYLPKKTYDALVYAIDNKEPLDREIADSVAEGMKQWALDNGAKHYTHWFHPLTDGTAEKHDSFIEHNGKGGVLEDFTGKLLVQQEPDASSFPNGGIRNTFEARGYSAWDISSPAFILGNTLCIPTIFISYTGEALDYKMPLLRALNSVDKAATSVAQLFDPAVKHVYSYLGWEQEYFLVDELLYSARPDLMLTGRTLMGHDSAKNQQLDDHYFGSIPSRVEAFMLDLEIECHKLGIPAKTRHNEVAPNQFELAPIYEETNLANDHNLLLMLLMEIVARRHNFRVLLHEKPFKGINGSGKHNNWSLGTDTGVQLFAPGKTSLGNLQFITFFVNVMAAVYRHNGLLKASISSATNGHRLGANEAPPAIISIFVGKQLSAVLDRLETSDKDEIIDNAAVADQLNQFRAAIDRRIAAGEQLTHAVLSEVKALIAYAKPIHFDGNGYSEEWKAEAARRGLDCETSVPLIFDAYLRPESIEMFKRTGVFSKVELEARNEVKWEIYTKKIQIEARVLGDLAINHILPVATRYQSVLLDNVSKIKTLFPPEKFDELASSEMISIEKIASHTTIIREKVAQMVNARKVANKIENQRDKAIAYHDTVAPLFDEIRYHIDKLELMIDDEMWPLPKYRELLFIR